MNEFDVIEKFFLPLTNSESAALGLKDDAAIIECQGAEFDFVITKDLIAEDVHFFKNTDPYLLAKKLVRVNISDLVSKGAKPYCYFLGLASNKELMNEAWLSKFSNGLKDDIGIYGGFLAGGDTICHDNGLVLSMTAMGKVVKNKAVKRNGARLGDSIYITGTIGDSYVGLNILNNKIKTDGYDDYFINKYHLPDPKISMINYLNEIANSACDVSDGLVADLENICEASNQFAYIDINKVPLSDETIKLVVDKIVDKTEIVVAGDDYELLFTTSESHDKIDEIARILNIRITKIGEVTACQDEQLKARVTVYDNNKKLLLSKSGYKH